MTLNTNNEEDKNKGQESAGNDGNNGNSGNNSYDSNKNSGDKNKQDDGSKQEKTFTQEEVNKMASLKLTDEEKEWLSKQEGINKYYLDWFSNYSFNPKQVDIEQDIEGHLSISIEGRWLETIMWEVPLLALVSELYYKETGCKANIDEFICNTTEKKNKLQFPFADFGTRRRRDFFTQDLIVRWMKEFTPNFVGTSNPYLAMIHGVKALGTVAHESIMGTSVLESLNHPNKFFMENWTKVYSGALGTMIPDTYGIDSFLQDFTREKAKLWDGVRHDSGDPMVFVDKIVAHYKKLRIDPTTKTIIFSDGLDVKTAIRIAEYCKGTIRCSFGIGTNFTNDYVKQSDPTVKSKALNMVIKLSTVEGKPVVKLSDSPGKAIGDPNAVKVAKWIHFDGDLT